MKRQMRKPLKKNYLRGPDGPRQTSSSELFRDANQSSELVLFLSAPKQIEDHFSCLHGRNI